VDLREAKPSMHVGDKMVDLSVLYNRIIARDVDLGARFADMHADIVVDARSYDYSYSNPDMTLACD
jgi:hypothetical protein